MPGFDSHLRDTRIIAVIFLEFFEIVLKVRIPFFLGALSQIFASEGFARTAVLILYLSLQVWVRDEQVLVSIGSARRS